MKRSISGKWIKTSNYARSWLKERLKEKPEHEFCAIAESARPEDAGTFGPVISAYFDGVRYFVFKDARARDAFIKTWKGKACPVPL